MDKDLTLNTIAKGAVLVGFGMVISKFLTYLYRAAIARLIGPEAYGQLSLGITVMSLGGTISLLAVNQALKKYVSEYESIGDTAAIKGTVLSAIQLTLPLSILAGAAIFLSADFIANRIFDSQGLTPVLKVFAFVIPFANFSKVSISTTIGFKKVKYRVITNQIFQNTVQLIGAVALIYLGYGVIGAAGGWLLGVILSSLLAFYFMERKLGPIVTSDVEPKYHRREMLAFSSPLLFSGIIGTVLGWSDTAFIGYFMSDTSVGFYNAALPTALLIMLPYQALKSLVLPSMSELANRNEDEEFSDTLKTVTRWTTILGFPAFIIMFLFSDQVLHILFGAEYRQASSALVILAAGYLFSSSIGHLDEAIKSISETSLLLKNSIANLALNIVLNIVLIPIYGIVGAAIATTTSIIFVNLLLILEMYYIRKIHPFSRSIWKPIAASLPGLFLVYFGLKYIFEVVPIWALIPGAMLYGTLYTIILIAVGGLNEEDRSIIVGAFRKIGREELGEKTADLVIR